MPTNGSVREKIVTFIEVKAEEVAVLESEVLGTELTRGMAMLNGNHRG